MTRRRSIAEMLFGSSVELPPLESTLWRTYSPRLETVDSEIKLSLHEGDPPLVQIAMVERGNDTHILAAFRMNLAALDAHIGALIKHRDLLEQMTPKGETRADS